MSFTPANNVENWIVEEQDSEVIRAVEATSAIERIARKYPMATDAKQIPRTGGMNIGGVAKGGSYGIEEVDAQVVTLVAKKFGAVTTINHEDLSDPHVNVLDQVRLDWARAYALTLDNACLGVTGAADHAGRPFISAYRALKSSNSETGYTADDNVVVAGTGGISYDDCSEVLGLVEQGNYYDPSKVKIIAHPAARAALRQIKDNEGRPIFTESTTSGLAGAQAKAQLFGVDIEWSLGARKTALMTDVTGAAATTGNRLLFVANADFLALGVRSGPESAVAGEDSGPAFMTDQALLKMRSRRAFALAVEGAAAVLEF